MNPLPPAVSLLVASNLFVAHSDGKTDTPPDTVVGQILIVSSTATTTIHSVVVNAITGAVYDTRFGHIEIDTEPK